MIKEQIINAPLKPLDSYNQADIINTYNVINSNGRVTPKITSNTLAVLTKINDLKVYNFGCISDMTLISNTNDHGTETTSYYNRDRIWNRPNMLYTINPIWAPLNNDSPSITPFLPDKYSTCISFSSKVPPINTILLICAPLKSLLPC